MRLKQIRLIICFCLLYGIASAQGNQVVKIETNKILCLFSFLEAAAQDMSAPPSLIQIIQDHYGDDPAFQSLVEEYKSIKTRYHMKRDEYPKSRDTYAGSKDFLWIASANAKDINDFNERIIGFLPHESHQQFIKCMREVEPYYDELIWNKESENIRIAEQKLSQYKTKIAELFIRISRFYGTEWKLDIPFKIMLYPIPAKRGATTAIPKGNNLICSFLSHSEEEYKHILAIAIHEMCHILYDAQPKEIQEKMEMWFMENSSEFNSVAYSYINEGLATVLGNGWAYRELHQELDTTDWYSDSYIDGFAHAMFNETENYMSADKQIDRAFVDKAIVSFGEKFPDATKDINILMTAVEVLGDFEGEQAGNILMGILFRHFKSIRSLNFSTPIIDPKSLEKFDNEKTKLVLIDSKHKENLDFIRKHKKEIPLDLKNQEEWIYSFHDALSSSNYIILNLHSNDGLERALTYLQTEGKLKYNVIMKF